MSVFELVAIGLTFLERYIGQNLGGALMQACIVCCRGDLVKGNG